MPNNFNKITVAGLKISRNGKTIFKLAHVHRVARRGNFDFEIFKKSIDLGKDLMRTNVQWMSRLHRYLPIIGLCIGITSFVLQTILVIFDTNRDTSTKIAAFLLFITLSTLASFAFVLAASAPVIATALALCISVLNFIADGIKFYDARKSFLRKKHKLKKFNIQKSLIEQHKEYSLLRLRLNVHFCQLENTLLALLSATAQGDQTLCNTLIQQVENNLEELVDVDCQIQTLDLPHDLLIKTIREESQLLTLAAIALSINVVSIALVSFCLLTTGTLPIGISLLLCVNLLLDLAELIKNVIVKCKHRSKDDDDKSNRIKKTIFFFKKSVENIKQTHPSSYHKLLHCMPSLENETDKPIHEVVLLQNNDIEPEDHTLPDNSSDNELQLNYCTIH